MKTLIVIILLLSILIIVFVIGLIISHFEYLAKKKRHKLVEDEERYLEIKRKRLGIILPSTTNGFYPILVLPENIKLNNDSYNDDYCRFTLYDNEKRILGVSEVSFYNTLEKYFGDEYIRNNYYCVKFYNGYYVPDFTYMDSKNNINISIEIDEPYSFNSKMPTHYEGIDFNRNYSFKRAGWSVIRFSEKQVIQQPNECCKYFAQYLSYVYLDIRKKSAFLDITNELIPDRIWSKSDAEEMITNNYRDEYFKLNRIKEINQKYTTEEIIAFLKSL